MSDRLFDEDELRRLLRNPAGTGVDAAFEAAVLERIRLARRRFLLLVVGIASGTVVGMSLCLWMLSEMLMPVVRSFAGALSPLGEAIKPQVITAQVWLDCALAALPGGWPDLAGFLPWLIATTVAALVLIELGVCRILFFSTNSSNQK